MNVKFKTHLFIFSLFFCYNLSAQEIVKGDFKNENPQSSYAPSFDMDATDKPVKNVILMIGDGMGQTVFFCKCPYCGSNFNIRAKLPKFCPACGKRLED